MAEKLSHREHNRKMRQQYLEILEELTGPTYFIDEHDHLTKEARTLDPTGNTYGGIPADEVARRQKNKLTGNWFASVVTTLSGLITSAYFLDFKVSRELLRRIEEENKRYFDYQKEHDGLNSIEGIHRLEALAKEIIKETEFVDE